MEGTLGSAGNAKRHDEATRDGAGTEVKAGENMTGHSETIPLGRGHAGARLRLFSPLGVCRPRPGVSGATPGEVSTLLSWFRRRARRARGGMLGSGVAA
ncbi:unnamed protein product [Ectocarpus sp. 6 AP-2014]